MGRVGSPVVNDDKERSADQHEHPVQCAQHEEQAHAPTGQRLWATSGFHEMPWLYSDLHRCC